MLGANILVSIMTRSKNRRSRRQQQQQKKKTERGVKKVKLSPVL
jgi:hypothetical protein